METPFSLVISSGGLPASVKDGLQLSSRLATLPCSAKDVQILRRVLEDRKAPHDSEWDPPLFWAAWLSR